MGFQNGHTYGYHDNHRGGRPCKAFDEGLTSLAPLTLIVIKETLTHGSKKEKAAMARWVGDKFKPNLIDITALKELTVSDRFVDFAIDLASRISGFSKGNERRAEIAHNQTSVQAEH